MSKNVANRDARPFSRTSIHHGFALSMAMWFGTMSSRSPILRDRSAETSCRNERGEPSSRFRRVGSVMS